MKNTPAAAANSPSQPQPTRRSLRTATLASILLSAAAAATGFHRITAAFQVPATEPTSRKKRCHVPMMVTSSPAEIAAWNAEVERKRAPKRKAPRRVYETGQHPKFAPERQRKQHKHPLRDEHGAYTLTGSAYTLEGEGVEPTSRECVLGGGVGGGMPPSYTLRRKWLAGISAQRGY